MKVKKVLNKKIIAPHSRATLNAGRYSVDNPEPEIKLNISSIVKSAVKCDPKQLGDKDCYTLIYECINNDDSPCSVSLEVIE